MHIFAGNRPQGYYRCKTSMQDKKISKNMKKYNTAVQSMVIYATVLVAAMRRRENEREMLSGLSEK